jgi:two-component SAPR family response regulator
MTLTCAIVDDEPLALGLLESYVAKTPFLKLIGKYSNAVLAMKELPDAEVDLIFLDIQMPELNGLEFSKLLPQRTRIIFTTAFDRYAIDGYRCERTRLSFEAYLVRHLPRSRQQGHAMVRTAPETRQGGEEEHLREE